MQEYIITGKDVEEAIRNACAQLGVARDRVSVEILEMPQKKLFGMSPAKIRVTPAEGAEFKQAETVPSPDAAPGNSVTAQPKTSSQKARQGAYKKGSRARAATRTEDLAFETFLVPDEQLRELAEEELAPSAESALAYFRAVTAQMGASELRYRFYETERGVKFSVDGADSSLIIGRRGETMDALQYLCMLVGNRAGDDYCKIMLDVANYREKREKTLQSLAVRESNKVLRTRYNQRLEPMNPYERRIVHSAVQQIEGVKSESVGSDPNRRVVISLITGGKGPRSRHADKEDPRARKEKRERRDVNPPPAGPSNHEAAFSTATKRTPSASDDDENNQTVLYGRIDI